MQQVVPEDRDERGHDGDHDCHQHGVPAEDRLQAGLDDHDVDDVEAHEGEQCPDQWQ